MEWYIYQQAEANTQLFVGVCLILTLLSLVLINLVFWLIDRFQWEPGRQGGQYTKLKIWSFSFPGGATDAWLIKYQPHYQMPVHTDPVVGKHWRLNLVLQGQGQFQCEKVIWQVGQRLIFFRPDLYPHSMVNGSQTRTVLSFGWVFK